MQFAGKNKKSVAERYKKKYSTKREIKKYNIQPSVIFNIKTYEKKKKTKQGAVASSADLH